MNMAAYPYFTASGNNRLSGQAIPISSILELISRYAPRPWKTNPGSARGRYSLACPLPGHEGDRERPDYSGSFSVDEAQQFFFCFGCGGQGNARQLHRILSGGRPSYQPPRPPPQPRPQRQPSGPREYQPLQGVNTQQLARAKGLNPDYLRDTLGWRDTRYHGTPAVAIPYFDEYAGDPQIRYRVGLDQGDRFRWQTGAKQRPYGLWELERLEDLGYVIFVEGETDYATLDFHGFPVQGIPGASNWRKEWSQHYRKIKEIYAWQEPGKGGEGFTRKLAESFPHLKVIGAPPGAKDPTELADQASDSFPELMNELLAEAQPAVQQGEAAADARPAPPPDWLTHEEITELLGSGLPTYSYKPAALKPDVQNTVEGESTTTPYSGHPVKWTQTEAQGIWASASRYFPYPKSTRALRHGVGMWSDQEKRGVVVEMLSNTWRHPVNAQYKRRVLFFNLMPTLKEGPVYELRLSPDDWTPQRHHAIQKRVSRAGGNLLWVDNNLRRGHMIYLTDVPLPASREVPAFTLVEDVEATFVEALSCIVPPDRGIETGRFRPYGGSREWTNGAMNPVEANRGKWHLVFKLDEAVDWDETEASLRDAGIPYQLRYRRLWSRSQATDEVLEVRFPTPEDFRDHFLPRGGMPVGRYRIDSEAAEWVEGRFANQG